MKIKQVQGLVNQIDKDRNKKLFLFEIDHYNLDEVDLILETYEKFNLNCVYHRTGSGGYHFLSNTLLDLKTWKLIHSELIHLNRRCPMITLRIQAGKGGIYPNEDRFFYKSGVKINCKDPSKNVKSITLLLNKMFDFDPRLPQADLLGEHQIVKYIPKREK